MKTRKMDKALFEDFPKVSAKEWKQKIQADLKGAEYSSLITPTHDGIDIKPFYHRDDLDKSIMPENPKSWKVCEKIYIASEKYALTKIKDVLTRGAESLWLVVDSEEMDLTSVLKGFSIEEIPVFVEFQFLSEVYISKISRFLDGKKHQISFGNDIVGNLSRSGNWYKNVESDYESLGKIFEENPGKPVLSIDASLYQNAGANIPQEIAYAIAHANEYLNHFDGKTGKITFKVSMGSNYFFEIAKLKALRVVFSAIATAYDSSTEIKILAFPTQRNKTLYDYNVNMLRTATESMSAILGGADWVCNAAYDEIYHKENEFGDRIARNQLLVLKNESYFDTEVSVQNPAEGSYYIETLTKQFAEKALEIFKDIEKSGGFLKQLKEGTIQRKIKENAAKEQADFDKGKQILVGTNKYQHPEDRMKNELELYPFLKQKPRKTWIEPILEKRLAEEMEQKRIENE